MFKEGDLVLLIDSKGKNNGSSYRIYRFNAKIKILFTKEIKNF